MTAFSAPTVKVFVAAAAAAFIKNRKAVVEDLVNRGLIQIGIMLTELIGRSFLNDLGFFKQGISPSRALCNIVFERLALTAHTIILDVGLQENRRENSNQNSSARGRKLVKNRHHPAIPVACY